MRTTPDPDTAPRRATDRGGRRSASHSGFTFVEVSIAILVVTVLAAVVTLSLTGLTGKGDRAACARTADAVRAAMAIHLTDADEPHLPPTSFLELLDHDHLELPDGVHLDRTGRSMIADGWSLVLTPGEPPSIDCVSVP